MVEKKSEIEILSVDLVATWSLDLQVETCAICRNHLMDMCIECHDNLEDDLCTISWGKCGHAFHRHCIQRWLTTKNICPLDTQVWKEENKKFN
ncbi:RBX1 [Hepatospora eriocheir]|nr:RBX1 [Hepatospora eriocheir]